jgi:hypothetical protein
LHYFKNFFPTRIAKLKRFESKKDVGRGRGGLIDGCML